MAGKDAGMNPEGAREMTTKHTPGPWSVSKDGDDYNITYNADGNWLATVYDDDDPFEGRPEADARLIAAAPDLLEAAKAARKHIFGDLGNGSPTLVQLDTAIAKAEVRS